MKFLRILMVLAIALTVMYAFRRPMLRAFGDFLIREDELSSSEALFLLSGGPADRAREAACMIREGWAPRVICTGEVIPRLFEVIDTAINEAELSRRALLKEGLPDSLISLEPRGTSTREESQHILRYCQQRSLKKIIVVSDRFHTNRINYAFRKQYDDAGIEMILRGAPSAAYQESNWWASENGLLMVNNEYVKLCWYYLHY